MAVYSSDNLHQFFSLTLVFYTVHVFKSYSFVIWINIRTEVLQEVLVSFFTTNLSVIKLYNALDIVIAIALDVAV